MKSDLLLFVGSGLMIGSAILGVAIGLAFTIRNKVTEFRYGVFYSVFALVASIGFCLASIAFYFQFLGPALQIPIFCSLISLGFLVGFVIVAVYVKKDNRVLFAILSFYTLLVVWLAPLFLWNLIYLIFIARRSPKASTAQPIAATPMEQAVCAECGGIFNVERMIAHNDLHVCARCKPIFLQKLAEGATSAQAPGHEST